MVTNDNETFCPPIIYIALEDNREKILDALKLALVKDVNGLELVFWEKVYSKCSVLAIEHEHTRIVMDGNGEMMKYEESSCHSNLVPRYSGTQKFVGGIGHVFTLGIALAFKNSWPGWTNSDKMCERCKRGPGSQGCSTVGSGQDVNHCYEPQSLHEFGCNIM